MAISTTIDPCPLKTIRLRRRRPRLTSHRRLWISLRSSRLFSAGPSSCGEPTSRSNGFSPSCSTRLIILRLSSTPFPRRRQGIDNLEHHFRELAKAADDAAELLKAIRSRVRRGPSRGARHREAAARALAPRSSHSETDGLSRGTIAGIVSRLKDAPGALLPILHAIQDELGYVPAAAVPRDRRRLESVARRGPRRHQLLSLFPRHAAGPPHDSLVPRRSVPGDESADARSGTRRRGSASISIRRPPTASFTFEPVYCLGNCACSPSMLVDGELYGRVTPDRFDAIVAEWERR